MVVRKSWPLIDDLTISERMSIVKLVFFANLLVKFATFLLLCGQKNTRQTMKPAGCPKTMTQYESNAILSHKREMQKPALETQSILNSRWSQARISEKCYFFLFLASRARCNRCRKLIPVAELALCCRQSIDSTVKRLVSQLRVASKFLVPGSRPLVRYPNATLRKQLLEKLIIASALRIRRKMPASGTLL